ncbi:SMP-30/gluconolactonase/LRE family protein [Asticcacaulis sp.]|uniref:SMP-30/gluconolactonase/LRE family protein n=1 Tax=Asticcacaulis sp. TaxID=1872648 RepID=UPI00262AC0F2|nr:SMP-30/gluconolactonase/LRE family protein [Asticcacaulis sp.]
MWQPSELYPDPSVESLDPRFDTYRLSLAAVEWLYEGTRWGEGPVWFGDGRYLLWSDIPNDRILRWDEETGAVSIFRKPAHFANGHTRDRQGRLISCQHGTRSVTRTEYDGTITTLASHYQGKRLNSPNDVTDAIDRPNGICFSPDERLCYIAQSGEPKRIWVFEVAGDSLTNGRVFVECAPGQPDGFRCDEDGNLWCGWGGGPGLNGVRVFAPDGTAIGHIHLPNRCANLVFGGRARNRLFMTAGQSLFALYVNTRGA